MLPNLKLSAGFLAVNDRHKSMNKYELVDAAFNDSVRITRTISISFAYAV